VDVLLPADKCVPKGQRNVSKKVVEMRGIEPRAFHMQSERSTTELHPRMPLQKLQIGYEQRFLGVMGRRFLSSTYVYGHIMLKAPVLVRSLKLSNIESC
jgi:hypothetical protein